METAAQAKYAHLLESDSAFRAWYLNLLRGSHNTGSGYFPRMGRLCDELFHAAQVAALNRTELMTFISNAVSDQEERGLKSKPIACPKGRWRFSYVPPRQL